MRWFRFHLSTALVMMVAAGFVLWANLTQAIFWESRTRKIGVLPERQRTVLASSVSPGDLKNCRPTADPMYVNLLIPAVYRDWEYQVGVWRWGWPYCACIVSGGDPDFRWLGIAVNALIGMAIVILSGVVGECVPVFVARMGFFRRIHKA